MKTPLSICFAFALSLCPLSALDAPPVIYVMDFDASQAQIDLGQDQAVNKLFTDIAAMTLSNALVKQLKPVAPAQRITDIAQATAPGWLLTGSFHSITRTDNITVTELYKISSTAILTDLARPGQTLASFPAESSYYKGNESNADAQGGMGDEPTLPVNQKKKPGDELAEGLSIDSQRSAKRIVQLLRGWMSGK